MMKLTARRREMMRNEEETQPIYESITWSGTGADKTSTIIDATQADAYFTLPFVSGASELVEGATAESMGARIRDAALYSDAEATQLVGYYRIDTKEISSRRTTANSPYLLFNTEYLVVPKGYYAKLLTCRSGTAAWNSNDKYITYINTYGTEIVLK